ncbi:unnamed protein product [Calypogeia fissa]
MTKEGELPDLPSRQRKRKDGGPPRRKYPSDSIDYHCKVWRPGAKSAIWIPFERLDEWEDLRVLLGGGADTTHAVVIHWLLDSVRDKIDELRRLRVLEVTQASQDSVGDAATFGSSSSASRVEFEQPFEPRDAPEGEAPCMHDEIHPHLDTPLFEVNEDESEMSDNIGEDPFDLDAVPYQDQDPITMTALGHDTALLGSRAQVRPGMDYSLETTSIGELDSQTDDIDVHVVPDSQTPLETYSQPELEPELQPSTDASEIEGPTCRGPPRQPATVAFFDRHKFHTFVEYLLPRCHCPKCLLIPKVERVEEFHQVWSVTISCGIDGHDWRFVTGEYEPGLSTPLITPILYHSILCSGLTYSALESL